MPMPTVLRRLRAAWAALTGPAPALPAPTPALPLLDTDAAMVATLAQAASRAENLPLSGEGEQVTVTALTGSGALLVRCHREWSRTAPLLTRRRVAGALRGAALVVQEVADDPQCLRVVGRDPHAPLTLDQVRELQSHLLERQIALEMPVVREVSRG
ncbi:hypothetical protein [Nocardiopsis sp. NPDC006938]|uniref:hypothetical protein n=1 Tax=Nocardiopsis sp. NPDC006938 TaxID=3364337 RepID=UPI00367F812D